MKRAQISILSLLLLTNVTLVSTTVAQGVANMEAGDYLSLSWKHIATRMPADWYGTEEARLVAENILQTQKQIGGWAKNIAYHHLPKTATAELARKRSEIGATFDNGATISEMRFLANLNSQVSDQRYQQAFARGLDYIFLSQYDNGGWPQFYPVRKGSAVYSGHITYNDNCMVNILLLLQDIYSDHPDFASLQLSQKVKSKAKEAFDQGIKCILNTQIIVDGKPTVWCAQHDKKTLAPTDARSYELASFSGSESVDIVLLLQRIDHPSKRVVEAIDGAIEWFKAHQIKNIQLKSVTDQDGRKDLIVAHHENSAPVWARFYDLDTGEPFFCDRDGIKRKSLAEIGYERRNGYSWYTNAAQKLIFVQKK